MLSIIQHSIEIAYFRVHLRVRSHSVIPSLYRETMRIPPNLPSAGLAARLFTQKQYHPTLQPTTQRSGTCTSPVENRVLFYHRSKNVAPYLSPFSEAPRQGDLPSASRNNSNRSLTSAQLRGLELQAGHMIHHIWIKRTTMRD